MTEHRAAPASPPVYLELVATDTEQPHLKVVAQPRDDNGRSLQQQVLDLLTDQPMLTRTKLRDSLSVRNERLGETLEALEKAGQIRRTDTGWQRAG